jgi:hypothetical protein
MRWKIEEMHKHVKQAYQWEMIQLSSYTRLQNMNQISPYILCKQSLQGTRFWVLFSDAAKYLRISQFEDPG